LGNGMLRLMAQGRRWRRRSLRYHEENEAIEAWLAALKTALARAPNDQGARQFAAALAELPRLRKGYSDTYTRGIANYDLIFKAFVASTSANYADRATGLRRAMATALADPDGQALKQALPIA
ncbi:MAG: hypothetical protein RL291_1314, partial [Pseudomonadota bacterium]